MKKSPLASNLFKVDGVKGVFLGRDFITVTKASDQTWQVLKPQLFSVILDFLSEGKPAVLTDAEMPVSDTEILDTDSEVVATIKELLETRIRPAVQEDGGDIYYEGFDDMTGTCTSALQALAWAAPHHQPRCGEAWRICSCTMFQR